MKTHKPIPASFEVQPLKRGENPPGKCTCGHCGLSWDDDKVTSMTPAPAARCPFEEFHVYPEDEKPAKKKHKGTLLNEQAAVGMILDNYPGKTEFPLALGPDETDSEIEVDREFKTFSELEEAAKDWGDPLFLWIVREAKEGGQLVDDSYTADSIRKVLERGRNDLNAVIESFRFV